MNQRTQFTHLASVLAVLCLCVRKVWSFQIKERTDVPYPYLYKKGVPYPYHKKNVPYQRTVLLSKN